MSNTDLAGEQVYECKTECVDGSEIGVGNSSATSRIDAHIVVHLSFARVMLGDAINHDIRRQSAHPNYAA
jgi:hypothetical protein